MARRRVLVVSPHFDDVPLSLGETLRSGFLRRSRVRVTIVFGRTNWTEWLHPTPGRTRLVSLWRRIEETLASMVFHYRWTAERWPEVVLRTGQLDPASFLDPTADLSGEPLVGEVRSWLEALCRGGSGGDPLVLVPAGLGGHRDHMIIAAAAAALIDRSPVTIGFYEDRPYSAYMDQDAIGEHMNRLSAALRPHVVSGPVGSTTQRLVRLCYRSQMSDFFNSAMEIDRQRGVGETIWLVDDGAEDPAL